MPRSLFWASQCICDRPQKKKFVAQDKKLQFFNLLANKTNDLKPEM